MQLQTELIEVFFDSVSDMGILGIDENQSSSNRSQTNDLSLASSESLLYH